jgi:hypothetical protein
MSDFMHVLNDMSPDERYQHIEQACDLMSAATLARHNGELTSDEWRRWYSAWGEQALPNMRFLLRLVGAMAHELNRLGFNDE